MNDLVIERIIDFTLKGIISWKIDNNGVSSVYNIGKYSYLKIIINIKGKKSIVISLIKKRYGSIIFKSNDEEYIERITSAIMDY